MSVEGDVAELEKPIDETWHVRAMEFIIIYSKRHGVAPAWRELYVYMGWRPGGSKAWFRMQKLAKRGVRWVEGQERSLIVSEEGKAALKMWHKERKARLA